MITARIGTRRRHTSGAISLVAHCARPIHQGVKRLRVWRFIDPGYEAVNGVDALTSLDRLALAHKKLYNAIMRDGITKP